MKHTIITAAVLLAIAAPAAAQPSTIDQSQALIAPFMSKPVPSGQHVYCWGVDLRAPDGTIHPSTACKAVPDDR